MTYPNLDVYLDSGLIPSLGGSAGVGHHALMGRSILPLTTASAPVAKSRTNPLNILPERIRKGVRKEVKVSRVSEMGSGTQVTQAELSSDGETTARPKMEKSKEIGDFLERKGARRMRPPAHRRTSSMDGGPAGSSKMTSTTTTNTVGSALSASRQDSTSRLRALPFIPRTIPSAVSAPEPGQFLLLPSRSIGNGPAHPELAPSTHNSPQHGTSRHAKSNSWAAPLTARQSGIPLIPSPHSRHGQNTVGLLARLHQLIPPSRLDPLAPSASSSSLHPPTLLAGLAFVLEALVSERVLLSAAPAAETPTPLSLLRDRTSLQSKTFELDWSAMLRYLTEFGKVLEAVMEMLMGSEMCEAILSLVEMVKTYVDKTRKVFGEVAGLYMDGYSCMAGWWDEEGMRGSAKEVGRWGEMVASQQ